MGKRKATQNLSTNPPESIASAESSDWSALDLFGQLLQRYPLLFWGGLWLGMASLIGFALMGLLNPESVKTVSKQQISSHSESPTGNFSWHSEPSGDVPLWTFGAIFGSCAMGCWLLSNQFNKPASPKSFNKPEPPKPSPAKSVPSVPPPTSQAAIVPNRPSAEPSPVSASLTPVSPAPAPAPAPASPSGLARQPKTTTAVATTPIVTVVPAEESHPLDWGEASLADMMDIRKRRSLSSLLDQAQN